MNRCARCFGDLYDLAVFCPHCGQAHDPDFSKLIDRTIDQYRILRCLGQGGLSTVFAASDLQTGDVVVLKVSDPAQLVRRELSYVIESDQARRYWSEMLERMNREAETLATINHPNIVRFYGGGMINNDLRYVAMEYLRGRTLRHEIDLKRRLELPQVTHIAGEISSALVEVHSRGIIHRDINPRNVMIADIDSAIKLIDFGIAKFPQPPGAPPFTQYSTMSGTVAYASPEQCQSRALDHRTDLYSLGIVLYEMLTGERPFSGRTPTEIALKQIQSEPKPPRALNPEIPARLERAILRSLAKNPNLRQASARELAEELHAAGKQIVIPLLSGATEPLDSASTEPLDSADVPVELEDDEQLRLSRKRRRFSAAAAAAVVLLLLGVSGILLGRNIFSSRNAQPEDRANLATANVLPSASATPNQPGVAAPLPVGSDADALELAARQSQSNPAIIPPIRSSSPAAEALIPARPLSNQTIRTEPSPRPSSKREVKSPKQSVQSVVSLPSPPKTNPQASEPSLPEIVANRDQKPESEPDLTQAPQRNLPEDELTMPDRQNPDGDEPRRRRDKYRDRDGDNDRHGRRLPREGEREGDRNDRRGDDWWDEESDRIGPQLIQWRGRVDEVRLIKLEMPGVPGIIEIPRIYRDRVGVVEPPGNENDWRSAVLRIFGRGNVSILVRWWPMSRKGSNFSVRR
ncbi:MAG: protein kinase [Acidobacteria bacterium]|nr:protein kinase [Acidobacteriota bacterium]